MNRNFFRPSAPFFATVLILSLSFISGCNNEDPKPVNEEEVITTVTVTLVPDDGSASVTLKFYDADGEFGNVAPVVSVSGPLKAATTYAAVIELLNETVDPADRISDEIAVEADAHLFCFTGDNVEVTYEDEDTNGMPVGLITSWTTGAAGNGRVEIMLRHQPGTKTGECPGTGETDAQVSFEFTVEP